jgi:hypothetical protein
LALVDDVHHACPAIRIEETVMKKNTRYALLIIASVISGSGFIYSVIMLISNFMTPDGLNVKPLLLTTLFMMMSFGCAGGFVAMIGYKDPLTDIQDDAEWWTKWDRV